MSLSDCEKCWNTPCTCGYDYRTWSVKQLEQQIKMLQGVLKKVRVNGYKEKVGRNINKLIKELNHEN